MATKAQKLRWAKADCWCSDKTCTRVHPGQTKTAIAAEPSPQSTDVKSIYRMPLEPVLLCSASDVERFLLQQARAVRTDGHLWKSVNEFIDYTIAELEALRKNTGI